MTDQRFQIHVLASGSKGNASVVRYGKTAILIDAGISAKRIKEGLGKLQLSFTDLKGIFITHEHSDHIRGLLQMVKQTGLPVYTKEDTSKVLINHYGVDSKAFIPLGKKSVDIGSLTIEPFSISHDAVDPLGFSCYGGSQKGTFLTDTGVIDDFMLGHLDESTMLVLESNHDLFMLQYGAYTPSLKRRVAGPKGHLSNEATAQALVMMKRAPELQVVLAHRSEQNNTIQKVEETISSHLHSVGLRVGSEIIFQHGQPKECVSMLAKEGTYI